FALEASNKLKVRTVNFSQQIIEWLSQRKWLGNVAQLKDVVVQVVIESGESKDVSEELVKEVYERSCKDYSAKELNLNYYDFYRSLKEHYFNSRLVFNSYGIKFNEEKVIREKEKVSRR
ncbi:MAG: hypothetical protein D6780_02820, partial [Candidatus Dadabacteria bacterium]